ncbi:unnamed protein product, partial [Symbiodinium sp. CCMP2592]
MRSVQAVSAEVPAPFVTSSENVCSVQSDDDQDDDSPDPLASLPDEEDDEELWEWHDGPEDFEDLTPSMTNISWTHGVWKTTWTEASSGKRRCRRFPLDAQISLGVSHRCAWNLALVQAESWLRSLMALSRCVPVKTAAKASHTSSVPGVTCSGYRLSRGWSAWEFKCGAGGKAVQSPYFHTKKLAEEWVLRWMSDHDARPRKRPAGR